MPVFKGAESHWNVERKLTCSVAIVCFEHRESTSIKLQPHKTDMQITFVVWLKKKNKKARLSHADGPSWQGNRREWRLINQFHLSLALCCCSNYQLDNRLIQITWQICTIIADVAEIRPGLHRLAEQYLIKGMEIQSHWAVNLICGYTLLKIHQSGCTL